jgi:hypothetical protein
VNEAEDKKKEDKDAIENQNENDGKNLRRLARVRW